MEAMNGLDDVKTNTSATANRNNLVPNKYENEKNKRNRSTSRYRGRKSKDKHGKRGKEKTPTEDADQQSKVANAEVPPIKIEEPPSKEVTSQATPAEEGAAVAPANNKQQQQSNEPPKDNEVAQQQENNATSNKNKAQSETLSSSAVKHVSEEVAAMNLKNRSVKATPESGPPQVPEGVKKFTYDRQFLMDLSKKDLSRKRPESLPNLEVVLNSTHKINITKPLSTLDDFTPTFMQSNNRRGPFQPNKPTGPRTSQQGNNRGRTQKVIDIKLSSSSEVKLKNKAEVAWTRDSKKPVEESTNKDQPESKLDDLMKKMRGILNKLTPDNFEKLVLRVKTFPIENYDHLDGIISLIFDKAVDEQGFSATYAQLCQVLSQMTVKDTIKESKERQDKGGKDARFRNLIINKCQKEFEKDNAKDNTLLEMKQGLEKCDPEKKVELTAIYNYEETKLRKRSVGNIRFIGELYILKMLTSPIMMRIIGGLLKKKDEESLECLCKLLTTIGQSLESSANNAKNAMDELNDRFKTISEIVNSKKTSSRVRFLLMDVLDLRTNRWVPRREVTKPKTKAQVHEEIRKEEELKQHQSLMASNIPNLAPNRRNQNHHYRDDRSRERKKSHVGMTDEGWNTVGSLNTRRIPLEVNRLSFMRNMGGEGKAVELRAGGGVQWGKGSSGGAGEVSQEETSNRYSILQNSQDLSFDNRRQMGHLRFAPGGGPRSVGNSYASKSMPPPQTEMQHALSAVKQFVGPTERNTTKTITVTPLDEDEAQIATKKIVDHLASSSNYQESVKSVNETFGNHSLHLFVQISLDNNIDKNLERRKLIGKLYQDLFRHKNLNLDTFIRGTKESLEMVDDSIIDVPQIRDYFGQVFGFILVDSAMVVEDFVKVLSNVDEKHRSFIFISALRSAEQEMGPTRVSEMLKRPNFKWTDILSKDTDVAQFIATNKLSFSVEPVPLDPVALRKELLDLLKRAPSEEQVFGWIEANVSETNSTFVRALTTALVESLMAMSEGGCLTVGEGFEDKLKLKVKIVHKYVGNNEKLELSCLYGIQSLCVENEHPAGLMEKCCIAFYDQEVLCEESFYEWEKSKDPAEQIGKGVCVTSVRKFLTWLQVTVAEDLNVTAPPSAIQMTTDEEASEKQSPK